ncbi:MAG: hypothetical protein ABH863_02670 [Candidatus Micrarchaeota archaeon]
MDGIMRRYAIMGILLFALSPLVDAGVQLQSYAISPTTLKAGMSGTLSIVLNNPSSTEFVTGAYLDAKAPGIFFVPSTNIGDLGALGTTEVALPFKISETVTPGTIPIGLTLTYTSSVASGSNYKSFSIPITVSETTLLKVTDVQFSKDTIYPGDTFTIDAVIENGGGTIRNAVLGYSSTAEYTFDGTNKLDIGKLEGGIRKKVTIPVIAGNAITSGYVSIPFTLTFDDAVIAGNTEVLQFGPITAIQDYDKFSISSETIDANPGGEGTFKIIIRNTGSNELKNLKITLPDDSTFFTPLDFGEKTIESIKPAETKSTDFRVGIGTNIAAQVYPLPLSISYQIKSGSETVTKTVGVKIGGAPDLSLYISSNPAVITNDLRPYSISVQISNTGDSAVRALSISASSQELEILSPADAFIGTLNLDDYSTVQYDALIKKGILPGKYSLEVVLSYKDSYNKPHVETKRAEYEIFSQDIAALAGNQTRGTPLTTIIFVAVGVIIIYFVYRRFFKSNISQKLKLK